MEFFHPVFCVHSQIYRDEIGVRKGLAQGEFH